MPPTAPRSAGRSAPTPARRGRPSRRGQIFAAALHLFRERGFHATSINDIGAAAGVAGTAIYAHCETKQALFAEAIGEGAVRIKDAMTDAVADPAQSPEAALEALVRAYVRVVLDNADMNACYVLESRYLDAELRSRLIRGERGLQRLWQAQLQAMRPELGDDEARTMVQMAIFAVVALCVHKSRIESDELIELATAQVLGALRSPLPHHD